MRVVLKGYLAQLEAEQVFLPKEKRQEVPSITTLSQEVGITRSQMYRILNSEIGSLNLDVADKIITVMRQRGFDMSITNLLEYRQGQAQ